MSLRKRKKGKTDTVSFTLSAALHAYVVAAANENRVPKGQIIRDALCLDRDLEAKLQVEADRIDAFAARETLTTETDLAEVLARLVRKGLEAYEKK